MEKTYKRVPFTIELAKKIQSGEIEGRIVSRCSHRIKAVIYDLFDGKDKYIISVMTNSLNHDYVVKHAIDGSSHENKVYDLLIELPEETPTHEFKVNEEVEFNELHGNILSIKDGLVEVDIPPCGSIFVRDTSVLKHINRVQEKHEFKPFDKVLVKCGEVWCPRFFSNYEQDEPHYAMTDNCCYWKCIPYEGNQELVGTCNEPK